MAALRTRFALVGIYEDMRESLERWARQLAPWATPEDGAADALRARIDALLAHRVHSSAGGKSGALQLSEELQAEIRQRNALDERLYSYACKMSLASGKRRAVP